MLQLTNGNFLTNEAMEWKDTIMTHKSRSVFRVKPYRMFKLAPSSAPNAGAWQQAHGASHVELPEYVDHYGDKIRIFAKCIGGARPYETMDVMLIQVLALARLA